MNTESDPALIQLTAAVVSAFVGKNSVRASELPDLIAAVHGSLAKITEPAPVEQPAPELKPAVPIRKSVTEDYIVSLEDGRKFKSMKRYLSGLGMTPDDYRAKWGLAKDYPMVAPGYAARRSELAKANGLGSGRRKGEAEAVPPPAPEPANDAPQGPARQRAAAKSAGTSEEVAHEPSTEKAPARRRGRPKKAA